jgi:predicted dehydrogenase
MTLKLLVKHVVAGITMDGIVRIGLVGCGFMGTRHLYGFNELYQRDLKVMDLTAVCDIREENAEHIADLAKVHLGKRPTVYKDFTRMLMEETELDAVDIVVDPPFHHVLADLAFQAGKHVIVEKPMALTVKFGQRMVDSSKRWGKILAVAENYRRDPLNRLVKVALRENVIGKPYMVLQHLIEGGGRIAVSPWRHMKERGGILIDMGVHYADLLQYFLGEIDSVFGDLCMFEKVRRGLDKTGWPAEAKAKEEAKNVEEVKPTAEDTALAILRFESGVLGQWMMSLAGHGERLWQRVVYGSEGRMDAPLDRSGKPIAITLDDGRHISGEDILETFTVFPDEDATVKLFPEGLTHYELPFQEVDRRLIAIELYDFADAVIHGRKPEVDGLKGLKAVALTYAICESACLNEPVKVKDVENGKISYYQREIDEAWGIN